MDWILRFARFRRVKSVLIIWNRGLGDIPLALVATFNRVRVLIPRAKIYVLTRSDLLEGFKFCADVEVLEARSWLRKERINIDNALRDNDLSRKQFGLVLLENMDPNKWVRWQLGNFVPKLHWNQQYDSSWLKYKLPDKKLKIAIHVSTETGQYYGGKKDWPIAKWKSLIGRLTTRFDSHVILLGLHKDDHFMDNNKVTDLRGETSIHEALSVIVRWSNVMIAPDGGILNYSYYLNIDHQLLLVSLWGEHRTGLLRQGVLSPNKELVHVPILSSSLSNTDIISQSNKRELWGGSDNPGDINQISVNRVFIEVENNVSMLSLI